MVVFCFDLKTFCKDQPAKGSLATGIEVLRVLHHIVVLYL